MLDLIHGWQEKVCQEYGIHFIHASDEWYILAEQPFPPAEQYDGYLQLENGVGMMRLLLDEVKEEMENRTGDDRKHTVSLQPDCWRHLSYSRSQTSSAKNIRT